MSKTAVLFDIDGTLADISHRRSYLEKEKPDWKSFNDKMGDDSPNVAIVKLYKSLWATGEFEIVLVTGRNERHRKLTEQWLFWNEIPYNKIYMRDDNDFRADSIVKKEILFKLRRQNIQIEFVVDDRQQVVDMWRENGVTCLQCDVGAF